MTAAAGHGAPPLRIGLIGFGAHMAENLYPALRLSADFRIGAVSTRDPCRAADLARRLGIERAMPSWRAMLDRELVDAVVVAAPPDVHAEVLAAALPAGIHAFVEKPPAPRTRDLLDLIALAAVHRDTVPFVDFNFRYGELLVGVRRRFDEDDSLRLAKIRTIASKPTLPMWHCAGVVESFLYAVGIHAIDLAVWLFGAPQEVAAVCCALGGARFSLAVTLTFAAGATAVLDLGNYSNRFESSFELIGRDGLVARIDDFRTAMFYRRGGETARFYSDKETAAYAYPGLKGGFAHNGYLGALQGFVGAVRSGDAGEAGLHGVLPTYQVIDRILASIEGNCR